jgi:hypothetical protein
MADLLSPIEVPTVTIDGRLLLVKYNLYAEYQLSLMGISTHEALQQLASKDVKSLANMMDLWTACVAENFRKSKEKPPTAEEWARIIPDETWKECCLAVKTALLKVLRPAVPAQAPAAEATSVQ